MKNSSIAQRFRDYITKEKLFGPQDRLLVAVSGGVDSVVLCQLCHDSGFNFHIAHCNFNLRGSESKEDADFVKNLAAEYKVPYYEKEFDTTAYAEDKKLSIQVAARELRYNWFRELLTTDSLRKAYLLTAHHADDNVETILMNFFKGTGIAGLKGILPRQHEIVRPLLFAKKTELLQYAVANDLRYREDSSNASEKYTRNFFRNSLIPSIEKIFPAVTDNLAANAARFRDIHLLYHEAIDNHVKKLVVHKGVEVHIPVLKLKQLAAANTVLYEIIKDFGFSALQVTDVADLLQSETGKYVASPSHRIYRYNKWLIISPLQTDVQSSFVIEEKDTKVETKDFDLMLSVQPATSAIVNDKDVAMLDLKHITYPLILRKWKTGDYFYPLGMRKKKKLGRFLSDEKLTLSEKENTWVIESSHRIIWVVGRRIDDRCKVTGQTQQLLKIDRRAAK